MILSSMDGVKKPSGPFDDLTWNCANGQSADNCNDPPFAIHADVDTTDDPLPLYVTRRHVNVILFGKPDGEESCFCVIVTVIV